MRRGNCRVGTEIAMAALALVFVSPGVCQQSAARNQRADDEQDIRAAVIRKQMEDWIKRIEKDEVDAKSEDDKALVRMGNFKVFFVSIEGEDPSDDLLAQFRDIPRVIKKVSESEIGRVQRMPVIDKSSGERGIIFSANKIHWRGKDSAEVEGGYVCNGLCGAGIRFRVKRENGKWLVKATRLEWVS
jgi:hypothetical protein